MKIYIINREFYEDEYVLGVYDDKAKAEKIAKQFRLLENYEKTDYRIKIYEYELNKLESIAAERVLNSLEKFKENIGILSGEEDE